MNSKELSDEVAELIDTCREGVYWDFKEKHHDNKANLLHDILCLSNSIAKRNRYIIYGVSDPSAGAELKGVASDNRRSQTDIIDFLRTKDFAGKVRPEVEVRTLNIKDKEVDVLIIFDHPQKPYYLSSDYRDKERCVKANHIYSRTLDTNTPIDKSEDLFNIEKMWREKFGLDIQPAQRFLYLLKKPEEWDKDIGNKKQAYHKNFPEYQIQFGEIREFKEIFSYFYINDRSFIGTASFRYFNTELFNLEYIYCDEMRINITDPENRCIRTKGRNIWYMCYSLNEKNGIFLFFLKNGNIDFESRINEAPFILYENQEQRKEFEEYLSNNLDKLDAIEDTATGLIVRDRISKDKNGFVFDPVEMIKVQKLFFIWLNNSKNA